MSLDCKTTKIGACIEKHFGKFPLTDSEKEVLNKAFTNSLKPKEDKVAVDVASNWTYIIQFEILSKCEGLNYTKFLDDVESILFEGEADGKDN